MDPRAPWRALEDVTPAEPTPAAGRGPALQRWLLVAAGILLVAIAGGVLVFASLPPPGVTVAAPTAVSGTPDIRAGGIVVEVAGAVACPGVYELPPGARVADAIKAAGGYRADVDASAAEASLNLASKLSDGQLVRVPRRGEVRAGSASSGAPAGLIDLNTASPEQLDSLPGIGPATAAKIVTSREEKPFASVDDLVSRKLVTAATLAKFRDRVTVS